MKTNGVEDVKLCQCQRGELVLFSCASLTELLCPCTADVCWECVYLFHKGDLACEAGSVWVSSSSFSALPGDAAELKECVNTAWFVI